MNSANDQSNVQEMNPEITSLGSIEDINPINKQQEMNPEITSMGSIDDINPINKQQEMKPEITSMGSIEDINPINKQQEMKPELTSMGSTDNINPINKQQQEATTRPPPRRTITIKRNLPCGDLLGNRRQYNSICTPLYNASSKGDWEAAQVIFDKHIDDFDLVGYAISENYDTALHIAASAKRSKAVDNFVQNLVNKMKKEQLELENQNSNTALCLAAAAGNVKAVMIMLEKNRNLGDIPGSSGMLPLYMASLFGQSNMVNYLYDNSREMYRDCWTDQNRSWVLQKCVEADHFDVALKIVSRWPGLARSGALLGVLARKKDAFKATKPHFIWGILCPILAVFHVKIGPSEKPSDAMTLLKIIWAEILESPKDEISTILRGPPDQPTTSRKEKEDVQQLIAKLPDRLYKLIREDPSQKGKKLLTGHDYEQARGVHQKFSSRILFVAAEIGNTEYLVELIRGYPDLIWKTNDNDQTIFHVAAINRHEGIYNLLYEIGTMKDMITPMKDLEGNNMLHLVGKCVKNNHIQTDSGVGLQMQRELLWFKEVEALIPPSYRDRKNKNGLTPHELFMEEHKDLLSANEKWMKDTANQCLVVGALIASIAFAAAFGVPGGYNQNTGIPMFVHNHSFIAFAIADAISLTFSSISILIFLSIFISRYAELDFLEALPKKLMTGLATLFFSIAAMLVAFSVSFFVIFQDTFIWVPIIISIFISIPVILYVRLQYKLMGDVYHSIFGFKHMFRPKKGRLFYRSPSF